MKGKDKIFKKFIKERGLETSTKNGLVVVDEIGKFEVLTDGKTYMVLRTVSKPIRSVYVSTAGGLKKLMSFMRHIFNTQSPTTDSEFNQGINDILCDESDNRGAPLTLVQQLLKGFNKPK